MRYAALVVLVLAGCAPLSESECRTYDWAQIGERDGIQGDQPRGEIYAYQCSKYGLPVALKEYNEGWWVGNAEFHRRTDAVEGPD